MKKKIVAGLLMVLTLGLLVTSIHPAKAQFIISSWAYPDEYGQGIEGFEIFENTTGSWVQATGLISPSSSSIINVNSSYAGYSIKLRCWTWINSTFLGLSTTNEGKLVQKHNVTVRSQGDIIFSQQNFTWFYDSDAIDPPMWFYGYEVVLNFIFNQGQTYIATVEYEVYYETTQETYSNDCDSTNGIVYYSNSHLDVNDYGIGSNDSAVEVWILPDDAFAEGVTYKIDFTNINNTDGNTNITIQYKVEGATNYFYYRLMYDDLSYDTSSAGTSTSWDTLNIIPDAGKILDYIYIFNYDTPASTSSGNLSVWIDYIDITQSVIGWHSTSIAILHFVIPFDMWGLNMILIFGGLVLMIVSVCLIAVKVRDRTITRDAGILLFFLFCVGWGLFTGGTLIG